MGDVIHLLSVPSTSSLRPGPHRSAGTNRTGSTVARVPASRGGALRSRSPAVVALIAVVVSPGRSRAARMGRFWNVRRRRSATDLSSTRDPERVGRKPRSTSQPAPSAQSRRRGLVRPPARSPRRLVIRRRRSGRLALSAGPRRLSRQDPAFLATELPAGTQEATARCSAKTPRRQLGLLDPGRHADAPGRRRREAPRVGTRRRRLDTTLKPVATRETRDGPLSPDGISRSCPLRRLPVVKVTSPHPRP